MRFRLSYFLILSAIFINISCQSPSEAEKDSLAITQEEGLLPIKGHDIFYKTIGAGEPILFVHGGPGLDHSYLLPQMEVLAENFQLIFYDQRACGKSSAQVDSSLISIDAFVEDIEMLRQQLNLGKIHLLSHSWGSIIATHYANKHTENLRSFILLNPTTPNTALKPKADSLSRAMQSPEDQSEMTRIMQSPELAERKASAYEDLFRVVFKKDFVDKRYADSLTLTFPESFAQNSQKLQYLGRDLASYDLFPLMEQIDIPSLLIYGEHDPMAQLAGEAIHQALPNAQYEIIKDCGHFPYIEKQAVFAEIVNGFIGEVGN